MKNNLIKLVMCVLLLNAHGLTGQSMLNNKQMKEDLQLLKKILEESHPGLYRYQSVEDWNRQFDKALSLPLELSQVSFNYRVRSLLSAIQCGHTASYIPRELRVERLKSESIRLVPAILTFKGEVGKVLSSLSPNLKPGVIIESINGYKVDSLMNAWLPLTFQGDAGIDTRSKSFMRDGFPFLYHDLIGNEDNFRLCLTEAGKQTEVVVKSVSAKDWRSERSEFLKGSERSWFIYEEDKSKDQAYIRIRLFGNYELRNGEKGKFKKFLKQSFAKLQKENIGNLVIDLRENDGGEGRLGALLFSYIASEPFQYFKRWELLTNKIKNQDHLYISGIEKVIVKKTLKSHLKSDGDKFKVSHWYGTLKNQEPKKNAFQGKVYLLINGQTFSAASDFAAIATSNDRVITVGEETGGAYLGNNSGILLNYVLANSKIRVQVPLARGENNVNSDYEGVGVLPKYRLKASEKASSQSDDPLLEYAYQLIKQGR